MRGRQVLGLLVGLVIVGSSQAGEWHNLLTDGFARNRMGANWRMLRGDWRVQDGQLRVTRQWTSDNAAMCAVPLDAASARVELDVMLPAGSTASLQLRSGEILWGGGGCNEQFGVRLATKKEAGCVQVPADEPNRVVITIVGDAGKVLVNDKECCKRLLAPPVSETNRFFAMNIMPNGAIDNVRIAVMPSQDPRPFAAANTPAQNRQATIEAKGFIDPANPALGIQKAIDSLPPHGGVVILPAGEFVLRRHLHLRSNMTLRGQGPSTVLKAAPLHGAAIKSRASRNGTHTVTVADAAQFQVGDAVSLGPMWAHPGTVGVKDQGNLGVRITKIEGNTLTLTESVPDKVKTIYHFFPLIYARGAEFVEIRDLKLVGDPESKTPVKGRFTVNPITFGGVYGARITRVEVNGWKGDGISLQGGADAIVNDCTVTRTAQGFHPGTATARFLFSGNRSIGNACCGLYFCWYNRNGVYYRNTLDSFKGYADAGDVYNTIVCNAVREAPTITTGYCGVLAYNEVPAISLKPGKVAPGKHPYRMPGRYFILAMNRAATVTLGEGSTGNIVAGNKDAAGKAAVVSGAEAVNLVAADEASALKGFKIGVTREKAVPAPKLPEPVLDGRAFYKPGTPDCGFQAALDELARKGGGTLRLPAGRYALREALKLQAGVTLVGQGSATVLQAAADANSLVIALGGSEIAIRELTLMGGFGHQSTRPPALEMGRVTGLQVLSVDVRGWEGSGVALEECVNSVILDCRVLQCAGNGFIFSGRDLICSTNNAGLCRNGFVAHDLSGRLSVAGNIASRHKQNGFLIRKAERLILLANNASFNGGDGFRLEQVEVSHVLANTAMSCALTDEDGAGLRLGPGCLKNRVFFNNCSDEQIHPTQTTGILEAEGASANQIRFNVACPLYVHPQLPDPATILIQGTGSVVGQNIIKTRTPTGSSVEALAGKEK